jgi:hypothetical protein
MSNITDLAQLPLMIALVLSNIDLVPVAHLHVDMLLCCIQSGNAV